MKYLLTFCSINMIPIQKNLVEETPGLAEIKEFFTGTVADELQKNHQQHVSLGW